MQRNPGDFSYLRGIETKNCLKNRIQLEISGVKLLRWTEGSETYFGLSHREVLKIEALILVAKLIITENNIGVFSFKLL